MIEFEVAARREAPEEHEEDFIPIRLVDPSAPADRPEDERVRTLKAHRPNDTQYAMLMASAGRGQPTSERIAGYINFFINIFNEDDSNYLSTRLLDRHDPFELEHVEKIMDGLTGEWTGHPTQEPSGSTQSQQSTGSTSMPPPPPTSSATPLTVS